jgi:hypothetical protein
MPNITALRDLISLDATTSLVAAGYPARWLLAGSASSTSATSLTITGATNASPIVITTAESHGIPAASPAHVVISGVLGNTAANNLDATSNVDRAWVAVRASDTSFALYSVNVYTGALEPSTGNGTYTSGGAVKKAFTDGRILLGRQHSYEASSPPRVVFIPLRTTWKPKAVYNASRASGFPSAEFTRQLHQRSIRTDEVLFEVHVWGADSPPDPDIDFNITQVLYQQIVQSAHLLMPGTYELENGQWQDQQADASQLIKEGHLFVFGLAIGTPVLDKALARVPVPIVPVATTNIQITSAGSPEQGCSDA